MPLRRVRWDCPPYDHAAATRLSEELGVSPPVAAILARRGHTEPEAAARFLAAADRHDPGLMPGIRGASALVLDHVARGSRIVVHGDYDVDGVCSTAVLVRVLRRLGAAPSWHLPSRAEDGYGLSTATVERLAAAGTGLLVTVDCGIGSLDEVALARERGMDAVVTDHHRPGERLPDCPVVHPALGGYPCPDLCAAAVAHKLGQALLAAAGEDPAGADDDLDLVGLATVCDIVPLAGENRRLVREGLRALARSPKPGLRALMRVAAVEPGRLDARAAGFRLGPRLNAAGRLQRADAALELLLTDDGERAAQIADELDLLNRERRDVESRILFAAEAARAEQDAAAAFVLAADDWHPGVIGIVASRMVELHHRPCVLIALGPDGGRGSGRSIAAFDLHAGLAACSPELRRFGGHRMAAGLELEPDRVDAFRRAFQEHAARALSPSDLVPVRHVDAVLPAGDLGLPLAEELERLGPFGQGNAEPTLLVPGARVDDVRAMGEEARHARFTLTAGGARARAVAFRTSPGSLRTCGEEPHDVAVRLEANEWNGAVEPRLVLDALRPSLPGSCPVLGEHADFWPAVLAELDGGDGLPPAAPAAPAGAAASPAGQSPPAASPADPCVGVAPAAAAQPLAGRRLVDVRGHGVAGVVGDLLSTGARMLLVCADVMRRRAGVERVLGGLAASLAAPVDDRLALCSWHALATDPPLASAFPHVVALDPPTGADGEALLASLPGPPDAAAHLAWGAAEATFALRAAEVELDLRPSLADCFRTLRAASGAAGDDLARILCGAGAHPRSPALCARVLRVLLELGLVELDRSDPARPACRALDAPRTDLERSATYRASLERLAATRGYLEAQAGGAPPRQAAA